MKLSPLDIRKQEFSRVFRGYSEEEVQAFLDMVSRQWDEVLEESRRGLERIREMEAKLEHYEKVEEALQEALRTARENSKKAIENAESRADLILQDAQAQARSIVMNAESNRNQLRQEIDGLQNRQAEVLARLRAFLQSELEVLARFEPRNEDRRVSRSAGRRNSGAATGSDRGADVDEKEPFERPQPESHAADHGAAEQPDTYEQDLSYGKWTPERTGDESEVLRDEDIAAPEYDPIPGAGDPGANDTGDMYQRSPDPWQLDLDEEDKTAVEPGGDLPSDAGESVDILGDEEEQIRMSAHETEHPVGETNFRVDAGAGDEGEEDTVQTTDQFDDLDFRKLYRDEPDEETGSGSSESHHPEPDEGDRRQAAGEYRPPGATELADDEIDRTVRKELEEQRNDKSKSWQLNSLIREGEQASKDEPALRDERRSRQEKESADEIDRIRRILDDLD